MTYFRTFVILNVAMLSTISINSLCSEDTPEANPWIMLLNKLIEFRDIKQSLELIRKASKTCVFSYQVKYLFLSSNCIEIHFCCLLHHFDIHKCHFYRILS